MVWREDSKQRSVYARVRRSANEGGFPCSDGFPSSYPVVSTEWRNSRFRFTSTILLILGLLSATAALHAQRSTFRQYAFAEGLTDTTVHCILQDHTGFLWVGTDNGLFRFDGSNFLAFHSEDGLPDAIVRGIAESPTGQIWAATRAGIARLNGHRFEQVDVGQSGVFRTVIFDSQGRAYVENRTGILRGTPDGSGTYKFRPITSGVITGLTVVGDDVWFGRDKELWHLSGDTPVRIGNSAGLPADRWTSMAPDDHGNLWILSVTHLYELMGGLNHGGPGTGPVRLPALTSAYAIDRSAIVPHTSLATVDRDAHGRLYVSNAAGVTVIDPEQVDGIAGKGISRIDAHHGLPADSVVCTLVDREGSLWIGAEGSGLIRQLGLGAWASWKKDDGLLHNSIWSLHRDRLGREWVGSTGGLNLIDTDGKVIRSLNSRNGLPGNEVFAIARGKGGDMYVATYPSGITRFSEQGQIRGVWRSPSVLATGWILAMAFDFEGRLWTVGGAGCFRTRDPVGTAEPVFERILVPGTLPSASFYHIVSYQAPSQKSVQNSGRSEESRMQDAIWISTSQGLARFANEGWRLYTKKDGLRSDDVTVSVPGNNQVWVGYEDSLGLTHLQLSNRDHATTLKATTYTKADGLASNKVFSLGIDPSARLWVATDAGVDVLTKGSWHRYDTENGLIWNDTDGLALDVNAEGDTKNPGADDVWIGTSAGISRYTPPLYSIAESAPAVILTSIEGASRQWEPTDHPALPYKERSLSVHFAALNFASESRIRFRYRLLGYNPRWVETRERSVRFEGLPAGDYTLQLIAIGPNNLASPMPAEFTFSIESPWWLSWWFLASSGALLTLLIAGVWNLRVRVLVAQKINLERIVSERTAELRENQRKLEEIAYSDTLTQLPNRRRFNENFRERFALAIDNPVRKYPERFALLLIDLDHFKQVNDTFGHDAGDLVLIETAKRLKSAVRDSDCVARLGGDEFAVLVFDAKERSTIETVCQRIVENCRMPIAFEKDTLHVTASVGVALFPEHGDSQTALYKAADIALYEAKQERSKYCFRQESGARNDRVKTVPIRRTNL